MKRSDLMRMELIGLDVEVLSAPCYAGTKGIVLDETMNTFIISSAGAERMIPKRNNEFAFTYEGNRFVIKGSEVLHRPEDRIKKVR
ncbi:MAG: ribonuclease P protein subunit [Methanomassiliicoccaceae archaeon]|nr:ribonuclease P protein subunit [Methanomassiliicoccaceae archaeon]